MTRALIWGCWGGLLGVVALACYGAVEGYFHGWPIAGGIPPGPEAARVSAFTTTAYFWWLAGGVGAWFGGLTGLGSACAGRLAARGKARQPGPSA